MIWSVWPSARAVSVVGDGEPEQGYYYRSDHFNFAAGGVPALMPWTGVDFVEGGEAVGRPYYQAQMAQYYHKLDDEWRPDYDFTAALQNLKLLYELGQEVADSTSWPQWKPTAEFAAIRRQSDAARRDRDALGVTGHRRPRLVQVGRGAEGARRLPTRALTAVAPKPCAIRSTI
jgi:hypothetical protein